MYKYDNSMFQLARLEEGLCVKELAELSGITAKTIYHIERGKTVTPQVARKIAQALGREVREFIKEIG